jgi:tetratricopeptide (TPR) repeat protein
MLGQILDNKLEIVTLLGSGGAGSVYKAHDLGLDRDVAVKILHAAESIGSEHFKRFQREAAMLERLDHPNIVQFFSFGVTPDGRPYAVLEYLQGTSLSDRLKEQRTLDRDEIRSIFSQILTAVGFAHKRGIVHRDLKPSNVLLAGAPNTVQLKVLDFGLAKLLLDEGQKVTRTGVMLGTPLYMSPEQCMGKEAGATSDIYSIGCMLYECIAGNPPFKGDSQYEVMMSHLNDRPFETGDISSPLIEQVLRNALAKEPAERYQTCEEFLCALEAALAAGDGAAGASYTTRKRKAKSTSPKWIMVGAVACAAMIAIGIFSASSPHKQEIDLARAADSALTANRFDEAVARYGELADLVAAQTTPSTEGLDKLTDDLMKRLTPDTLRTDFTLRQESDEPYELFDASARIFDRYIKLPERVRREPSKIVRAATYVSVIRGLPYYNKFHGRKLPVNPVEAREACEIAFRTIKEHRLPTSDVDIFIQLSVPLMNEEFTRLATTPPTPNTPQDVKKLQDFTVALIEAYEPINTVRRYEILRQAQAVASWTYQVQKNYKEGARHSELATFYAGKVGNKYALDETRRMHIATLLPAELFADALPHVEQLPEAQDWQKFYKNFYRGWALTGLGKFPEAERTLREAAKYRNAKPVPDQDKAMAYEFLAAVTLEQKKYAESEAAATQAVSLLEEMIRNEAPVPKLDMNVQRCRVILESAKKGKSA